MMQHTRTAYRIAAGLALMAALPLALTACQTLNNIGKPPAVEAELTRYPVDPDIAKLSKSPYRTLEDSRGKVLGDLKASFPFPALFADDQDTPYVAAEQQPDGSVNSHLWRAALDTVGFMPIEVTDLKGGVIQTGWYEDERRPNERFKVNVFVVSEDLRPDGVRVGVVNERRDGSEETWRAAGTDPEAAEGLRSIIVDRAAELAGDA